MGKPAAKPVTAPQPRQTQNKIVKKAAVTAKKQSAADKLKLTLARTARQRIPVATNRKNHDDFFQSILNASTSSSTSSSIQTPSQIEVSENNVVHDSNHENVLPQIVAIEAQTSTPVQSPKKFKMIQMIQQHRMLQMEFHH